MEKRKFGNTGLEVSLLGFGGAEIGYQDVPSREVEAILNTALDAGLNVVDTAECYPNSEEKIGNTISARRSEYHLFSKVGHEHDHDADWTYESLSRTIDRSLKRLKTDHIDLVLLHSCSLDTLKQGEAIRALHDAKDSGKIRFTGYSGDSDAAEFAVESGQFDALEISVNIADQEAIKKVLPKAIKNGLGVIAKRPVANVAWRTGKKPEEPYHHTYWNRLQELNYPFINSPEAFETAIHFTASVPGVHTMIVGTTNPNRFVQNKSILETGSFSRSDYEAIRNLWNEKSKSDWVGQT